jgi:ATP adenylyltransferase
VRDLRGLGFFNCGTAAGASQPRKHMQVVPLDAIAASRPQLAAAGVPPVPMEAAVNAHLEAQGWRTRPGVPFRLADLQFKHAACSLGGDVPALSDEAAAAALHGWYTALLRAAYAPAGVDSSASASAATRAPATSAAGDALLHAPHSLLLTPSWMMAVPRSTDRWGPTGDVPVNSLAYAGFLLTRASSVAALQADGPMAVLRKCGLEL